MIAATYQFGDDRVSVIERLADGTEIRVPWGEWPEADAPQAEWDYFAPIANDPNFRRIRAAFDAGEISIAAPRAITLPAPRRDPRPTIAAMADLAISGDDISGVELAVGIGFAMAIAPNVFWLFFSEPQPDMAFLPFAQARGSVGALIAADVTDTTTDFVEITTTDRTTGAPAAPARLALSVQRIG